MLYFSLIIAYLFGSIPWALIIGKVFYKTDIRQHGSGNLGGSNAGRVLGKKAGLAVTILDAVKALIVVGVVAYFIDAEYAVYSGLACAFGHSYPIFAGFKGGKSVATTYGYVLGIAIFITNSYILFLAPITLFLIILKITKYVSLSSMISISFAACISFFISTPDVSVCLVILAIFIIYRHRSNIEKIRNKTEKKISWM